MRNSNLLLAGLVGLTGLLSGCAETVGDIDRTQPNLLDREIFEGTWFIRQTIVDVPPTSVASFVGSKSDMEMIRWEFTQDYLIAYRAYELLPGSNDNADAEGAEVGDTPVKEGYEEGRNQEFKENPIIAYPVKYIDVQRGYNARTGEQTNVIQENTADREWHERKYVRVSWSSPTVSNMNFINDADAGYFSSASFWVQDDEKSPDAFTMDRGEDGVVNYLDFTDRIFVNPSWYACILSNPWYGGNVGDCTSDEVKIRTSILKVDEERETKYESLDWDDKDQGHFGYFRRERNTYNRDRGPLWSGKIFMGERHDIWEASYDGEGNRISPSERNLRPIVYTLSENYPEDLLEITANIADEWDQAFKATAAAARGQSVSELTADLEAQTGDSCLYCLDLNEDNSARNGDLRHNFIYWVQNDQQRGPLGYGPSDSHPETGRIVSANAYVYGAAVDRYAQSATDMVRLINGEIDETEFRDADFVREVIAAEKPKFDPRKLEKFGHMHIDDPHLPAQMLGQEAVNKMHELDLTGLPPARHGFLDSQFRKIEGTPLEATLMTDEVLAGVSPTWTPGTPVTSDILEEARISQWGSPTAMLEREVEARNIAERNNIWMADFQDPALIGLARWIAEQGWDEASIKQYVREHTYKAVMLHEIGHTLGLRHNFGGSADPLNYMDEYWQTRTKTFGVLDKPQLSVDDLFRANCTLIDNSNRAACEEITNARTIEYQQSSIMDYGARFNSDYQGLGKYDWAAIAAGYGDLVEVFDREVSDRLQTVALDNQGGTAADYLNTFATFDNPFYGNFADTIHYVNFPAIFGNTENIGKRKYISRSEYEQEGNTLVRVPYYACYDEFRDATARCHTWDQGADHYEITQGFTQAYKEYYIFNNFQRDRLNFSSWGTLQRVLFRYFLPLQNMYQNWIYGRSQLDQFGELYSRFGMMEGFEVIYNAMAGPIYGSYARNGDEYEWRSYDDGQGDLYVPRGEGRRLFSTYDWDSGYNFSRRLMESGVFYEQYAALIALVSSESRGIGIGQDAAADALSFSLPYNLYFGDQLNSLLGNFYLEQQAPFSPRVIDGQVVPASPFFMEGTDAYDNAPTLNYRTTWSARLYSALIGMSGLSVNYDVTFPRGMQVAIGGSGDVVDPGEGFEQVNYSDPVSGRVFSAWKPVNDDGGVYPASEIVAAMPALLAQQRGFEEKLELLNPTDAQLADPQSEYNRTLDAFYNVRGDLYGKTVDLEILRGMYQYFGTAF